MREDTINRLSTKPAAVHARHSNATAPSSRASRSSSVWGLRRRRSRSGTRRCAACRGVVRDRRPTLLRAVRHRHGARPASRRRRCRCGSRGAAVARLVDPPRRRSRSVRFGQSEPLTDAQVVGIVGALVGPAAVVLVGSVVRGLPHGLPAYDPVTLLSVAAILVVTAVAATWTPARKALQLGPAELLREE